MKYNTFKNICFFILLTFLSSSVLAGEWWEKPWDYKVAPNKDSNRRWRLECVNDMGGTPETDNQRDISKSLGRIRKFREQTIFRLSELRETDEIVSMGKGFVSETISKASPKFNEAEKLVAEVIVLQKNNEFKKADKSATTVEKVKNTLDKVKQLLNEGELIAENAISILLDKQHILHLRNAIIYADMPNLSQKIDQLEAEIEKKSINNFSDSKNIQEAINLLKDKLGNTNFEKIYAKEFSCSLDLYQYLLDTISRNDEKFLIYDEEKFPLDTLNSDLKLNVAGSPARRLTDLELKLRRLSNRMSAASGLPMTESISDKISVKLGFPVDDLNYFTRSKFGWIKTNKLIGNDLWKWEFNYTPPEADAISIAGMWKFQIDPEFKGEDEGWFKNNFDAGNWKYIFSPQWWEREGITFYNKAENIWSAQDRIYGKNSKQNEIRSWNIEHRQYNGVAWYRKSVYIPKNWVGSSVSLRAGVFGGDFCFYINGKLAGNKWEKGGWGLKDIKLSSDSIKFGQVNDFTAYCFNASGPGGFAEGPLWLVKDSGKAEFRRTPFGLGYSLEETYGINKEVFNVNIVQSAMSPGVIVASNNKYFYMWGWGMKGYASPKEIMYTGDSGIKEVKLDKSKNILYGSDMKENWILINPDKGYGRPVLAVFQHKPLKIQWDTINEVLTAEFNETAGQVGLIHACENGTEKKELLNSAKMWSRGLLAYPVSASEFFKINPEKVLSPFEVEGTFTVYYNYHIIKDDWNTKPLKTAALPTLYSLALDYIYPGTRETEAVKTGIFSNYDNYARCEFRLLPDRDKITYVSPCADNSALWKGIGTFTGREVLEKNSAGYLAVEQIKKWGTNTNRLALHLHTTFDIHLQKGFGGEILPTDDENWKKVDKIVKDHVSKDMRLILLDFPDDQGPGVGDDTAPQTGRWLRKHPEAVAGLAKLWTEIATRYKNIPANNFGYNFFNEPSYIDPETYSNTVKTLTEAVRKVDRDKWITIDAGDGWAQPNWFFGTKLTGDKKTVYQFHFYYKHDGIIEGNVPEQFYPQWGNDWPFFYMNSKERYTEEFLDTVVYQTVYNVPVWCGEFGGSINNPNQELLLWLEDNLTAIERMGQGWNWWNWDGENIGRTGLQEKNIVSPAVLVLKKFMARKGIY